jgi:hypothetical protein
VSIGDFKENWALFVAAVLISIVALTVAAQLYRLSSRGQLRAQVAMLARRRKQLKRIGIAVQKAEHRLAGMAERADRIRPRIVQESKDRLADAQALQKISHDQVLIAENYLRRVIHEEYPPRRHEELRARYLPANQPDKKPFSF